MEEVKHKRTMTLSKREATKWKRDKEDEGAEREDCIPVARSRRRQRFTVEVPQSLQSTTVPAHATLWNPRRLPGDDLEFPGQVTSGLPHRL